MADYELIILGEPKAQKRHRHTGRDGAGNPLKFVRTYDPSATDKQNLHDVVQRQAPAKPLLGPLRVDCHFYFGHLKGHYGSGKNAGNLKASAPLWKNTKPDRDNLDKFVLDAITGVFFLNDSQVCDGRIIKKYSERPRMEIFITQLRKEVARL